MFHQAGGPLSEETEIFIKTNPKTFLTRLFKINTTIFWDQFRDPFSITKVLRPTLRHFWWPTISYTAWCWSRVRVDVNIRLQRDQEFSIPGLPGRDFAKSQDPGNCRDGIRLKFLSRDFTKKVWVWANHKLYVSRWRISLLPSCIWCILPSNTCILRTYGYKVANLRKWGLNTVCSPHFRKFLNMVVHYVLRGKTACISQFWKFVKTM